MQLHHDFSFPASDLPAADLIYGDWSAVRAQLLLQWHRLLPEELDRAGPDRRKIALLIERRYGIAARLVENYLRHFERTMPLSA